METKQAPVDTKSVSTAPKTTEIVRMQPNVDTRIKTEDVTNRKGLEFKDFGLSEDLMLVSSNLLPLLNHFVGHLRDGL